jgi:hypothetical protein
MSATAPRVGCVACGKPCRVNNVYFNAQPNGLGGTSVSSSACCGAGLIWVTRKTRRAIARKEKI